ncbi:S-adenosylmethionine decarboxylase proenzyme [Meyerozyma sp. JA9]|nr:S-adenosylmethionine decarboxylase proenzyme [Meyerozyma sp. JA9]
MVAPAYAEPTYVDHELSANLDSTFAFEGPEKLLEIWFFPSENDIPRHCNKEGLRAIPLNKWSEVLDLVSCKILSMKSSDYMDAYLLSESSLFVFPHKMILKTCGTTTTLACLDALFATVEKFVTKGRSFVSKDVQKIFYSRRSFMFPEKQKHVHRDWKSEVSLLNKYFDHGKSYVVGDFTSDDHWYLYSGGTNCESDEASDSKDITFEVLMTKLDPLKANEFVTSRKPGSESLVEESDEYHDLGHDFGMETMRDTELDSVFESRRRLLSESHLPSPSLSDSMELESVDDSPFEEGEKETLNRLDFIHDAFSFSPCGFSSNSISSQLGGYYYTLHITPESGWSYASFETNYPFNDANAKTTVVEVLIKVLSVFSPGRFSATLIADQTGEASKPFETLSSCCAELMKFGYKKQDKIFYDMRGGYKLLYLNYQKC